MTQDAEFSRSIALDTVGVEPRTIDIAAAPDELAALARRFDLVAIDSLSAQIVLKRTGEAVVASGRLSAAVTQSCVATAEPVDAEVDERFEIHFLPEPGGAEGEEPEIELEEDDLDVTFFEGGAIDVGEAVAQTLALGLDPYPRSAQAEEALAAAGVKSPEDLSPFAALAALRDKGK